MEVCFSMYIICTHIYHISARTGFVNQSADTSDFSLLFVASVQTLKDKVEQTSQAVPQFTLPVNALCVLSWFYPSHSVMSVRTAGTTKRFGFYQTTAFVGVAYREEGRGTEGLENCLLVACLTSQQHASVSQGRICSPNFTCCHTEIEFTDQTPLPATVY